MTLKQLVEENDTRWGRVFDLVIQGLIVVSLLGFSVDTLPDISTGARGLLRRVEIFTIAVFTLEYGLRILVANRKFRFIFSLYGLIDVLAIAPFYLNLGLDLRSLRALRFLRLFRAFKLLRYSRAIHRLHRAFLIAKEELVLFFAMALLMLYFSAVGIYYFEHSAQPTVFRSVFDSLWWAVVTLTSVGYGDIYPITVGGKIFTFVVLMLGLGIVAVPTGLIATALSSARAEEQEPPSKREA